MKTILSTLNYIQESTVNDGKQFKYEEPNFVNIKNIDYMYINNISKFIVECDVVTFKSKFTDKGILLKNIKFPSNFLEMYRSVLFKYFKEQTSRMEINEQTKFYDTTIDITFGKDDDLVLFPKIRLDNEKLEKLERGHYKILLSFGTTLKNNLFNSVVKPFKINFYLEDYKQIKKVYTCEIFEDEEEYRLKNID